MRNLMLVCLVVATGTAWADGPPPNFVVILADDLGYADLSCYGAQQIRTPRIDQMAAEGARLTNFYAAAPFCSPTRAALLTGRLPARCGVPYVLFPAEHTGLPPEELTIAEMLQQRGYATACIGKWHLGWDRPFRPRNQGFDRFFGVPYSNDSNLWPKGEPFRQIYGLEPLPLMDNQRVVEAPVDQSLLTRRYTERAVQFLREHRNRPFFLYLAHTMPHTPLYASPEFAGRSAGGLYGDAVEELDWSTGLLLDALRELELEQNTLVVFTSDNGPAAAQARRGPSRFGERTLGGSAGNLRGHKGQTFEGGMRVPAVFYRPGWIPPRSEISAVTSVLDLLPTFATLADARLPENTTFDGHDLSALLRGETSEHTRPFYYYFGVQLQAVRQGRWKLLVPIERYPDPRPPSIWYDHAEPLFARHHRLWPHPVLYDLDADPGETTDLATSTPKVVERLLTLARQFDAQLQADRVPPPQLAGPPIPEPGAMRTDAVLEAWHASRAPRAD